MVLARFLDSAEQAGLFQAAGDRSKLIRPTFHTLTPPHGDNPPAAAMAGPAPQPVSSAAAASPVATGARANKMIDAVLDELPSPEGGWDEEGMQAWLAFFRSALRVVYKLPKPSGAGP